MIHTSPFTVIQGGGEAIEVLKPRLVRNEDGKVCMEVRLGEFVATLPLPEHLAGADEARLEAFFNAVVPEMTENLRRLAAKERRKGRNKAIKAMKA